jgi:hypothetical protein
MGEETLPLERMRKAYDFRLLPSFDLFSRIGGSAIIYLPTSGISPPSLASASDITLNKIRLFAVDEDSNELAILLFDRMPVEENAYKKVLRENIRVTDPFTGDAATMDNISALLLFNGSYQTIAFGY